MVALLVCLVLGVLLIGVKSRWEKRESSIPELPHPEFSRQHKQERWLRWDVILSLGLHGEEVEVNFLGSSHGEGLWSYHFPDGRYYEEAVQYVDVEIPVVFLGLKDVHGEWVPGSQWPTESLRAALHLLKK